MQRTLCKKVKRALFLCDFFSSLGGTEYYNVRLIQALIEQGIEVRVYIGERPRILHWCKQLDALGVFYRVPEQFHQDIAEDAIENNFVAEHVNEINAWKPDIIQTHPFKKLTMAWLKNKTSDKTIPIIATEWTVPCEQAASWFEPNTSAYINKVHTYIATCHAIERGLRDYLGYKGPVAYIPHLLSPPRSFELLTPNTVNASIACISRLSVEKGLDFLIGAWKRVHEDYPAATLTIYGHGPDKDHLIQLRNMLNLSHTIQFAGTFSPEGGIDRIADRHSIFVQPSLFESIPTSLIEVMLRGRAVIATNVGGVSELVQPDTGMLVSSGSTDALSEALLQLLSNPQQVAAYGMAAAKLTKQQYALDHTVLNITNLYTSILNSAP
jgi:glycosyltransferase involved in cell wall biosynthesis